MSACRVCSAPIVFVRMRSSGKPMPVDPIPDERGNIAALRAGKGQYVDGHYLHQGQAIADGEVQLMPHFATCNDTRKPTRPRPPAAEPTPSLF